MSDEDEDVGDGEEDLFEVVAGGNACERCDALDGRHFPYEPGPFHARCDCEVREVPRRGPRAGCSNTWEIRHEGNTRYGAGGMGLISSWTIIVTCDNGETYEADAAVDHGEDPSIEFDIIFDEAWSELYDDAEELVAQNCKPCPDDLVS